MVSHRMANVAYRRRVCFWVLHSVLVVGLWRVSMVNNYNGGSRILP